MGNTSPFRLTLDWSPAAADLDRLDRERLAFDALSVGEPRVAGFAVLLRDEAGTLRGGLDAAIRFDWLFVKTIWVEAALRGRGFGQALLREAEATARERRCHGAWLFTLSAEARRFYERQDYDCFAELPNYAGAAPLFLLRKLLATVKARSPGN